MAIIRSTILSDIRGSINGTTFARNRYGAFARNRTVPVNPNTTNQQSARAALTQATVGWRDLTAAQRGDWEDYASQTPLTNKLGEVIYLSGQATYVKYATFALFRSLSIASILPSEVGSAIKVEPINILLADSGSASPNQAEVSWQNGSPLAASQYTCFLSPAISAGKTFYKGPWIEAVTVAGTGRDVFAFSEVLTLDQTRFLKFTYRDEFGRLGPDTIVGPLTVVNVP